MLVASEQRCKVVGDLHDGDDYISSHIAIR